MSSDDPTNNLTNSNEDDKATQPTITAMFRFLHDLDKRLNGRLEKLDNRLEKLDNRLEKLDNRLEGVESRLEVLENRLDALESRLARDFASVDARFAELSDSMKGGLLQLSDKLCDRIDRSRLHAESDYEDLLRRLRKLESKAS
jgi:chromosome segregation ATPase